MLRLVRRRGAPCSLSMWVGGGRYASTFSRQGELPRLPVPPLEDTVHRYLKSLLPLLSEDEFNHEQDLVKQFCKPKGPGQFLQQKLTERASQKLNWLEEYWDNMYLALRDPIPVNVPYFLQLKDVPSPSMYPGGELQYASRIISTFFEYKGMIDREEVEPDTDAKGNPLCMNQFARLFNHARIPKLGIDELKCYHKAPPGLQYSHFATEHIEDVPSDHVVVICNKHIYKVNVADSKGPLSPASVEATLRALAEDAQRRGANEVPVQTLTYANRDVWAEERKKLETDSETNRRNLELIDSSLFVVCLDRFEEYGQKTGPPDNTDSSEQVDVAHRLMLGQAGSRWYDKHQLTVFPYLRAGVTMEHAPGDATPVLRMLDWAIDELHSQGDFSHSPDHSVNDFERLFFTVPESVESEIAHVTNEIDELEKDVSTRTLSFTQYGSEHIKKQLGFSPDTFVQVSALLLKQFVKKLLFEGAFKLQLAIGLAWHKLYGFSTPQYESVATRSFLHGRTEAMRSTSIESMLFCQGMETPRYLTPEKRRSQMARMQEAARAHQKFMSACKGGKGVDRHFFGLLNIAKEQGMHPLPELFSSKGFTESSTWRLSTSNAGIPGLQRFGYGPVTPDGYGVGYMIHPGKLMFDVTAFTRCTTRYMHPSDYVDALRESFEEMESMCLDQPRDN